MVQNDGFPKTISKLRKDNRRSISDPLVLYSNGRIGPSARGLASGLKSTQSRYPVLEENSESGAIRGSVISPNVEYTKSKAFGAI
jgi:hypothetical protein